MSGVATLSAKSAKVMQKILSLIPEGENHVKIDRSEGVFMPLSVECGVWDVNDVLCLLSADEKFSVSLAHYGVQNGDLMSDPQVVFICYKRNGEWKYAPATYENSYAGIYDRDIFEKDGALKMNARSQSDLCEFCESWLENIADQQEL